MIKNLKKISTYYSPVNCESCGSITNYGEVIAALVYADYRPLIPIKRFSLICPNCYKRAIKTDRVKVPTCLSDPERRAELLERYKEV